MDPEENNNISSQKTSEALKGIVGVGLDDDVISIDDLNHSLHERSCCLLLLLFALPMAIPLPYPPGFTTVLGAPLLFLSLQLMMGVDDLWLPKWIKEKTIKRSALAGIVEKSSRYIEYVERFTVHRLSFMYNSKVSERLIGVVAMLSALSIVLPIPFGNAVPSLAIVIMALGILTGDGIIVIIGLFVAALGLAISLTVVILGVQIVTSAFLSMIEYVI